MRIIKIALRKVCNAIARSTASMVDLNTWCEIKSY